MHKRDRLEPSLMRGCYPQHYVCTYICVYGLRPMRCSNLNSFIHKLTIIWIYSCIVLKLTLQFVYDFVHIIHYIAMTQYFKLQLFKKKGTIANVHATKMHVIKNLPVVRYSFYLNCFFHCDLCTLTHNLLYVR